MMANGKKNESSAVASAIDAAVNAAVSTAVVARKHRGRPKGVKYGKRNRKDGLAPFPDAPVSKDEAGNDVSGKYGAPISVIDAAKYAAPRDEQFSDSLFHRQSLATWHKARLVIIEKEINDLATMTPATRDALRLAPKVAAQTQTFISQVIASDNDDAIAKISAQLELQLAELRAKIAERAAAKGAK